MQDVFDADPIDGLLSCINATLNIFHRNHEGRAAMRNQIGVHGCFGKKLVGMDSGISVNGRPAVNERVG